MRDKETADRIKERIENTHREIVHVSPTGEDFLIIDLPDVIERKRRSWLLVRNEVFKKELAKVHPLVIKRLKKEGQRKIFSGFWKDKDWQDFCYRWGISDQWAGDLDNLDALGQTADSVLYYRKPSEETRSIFLRLPGLADSRASRWPYEVKKERTFIYLKIVPSLRLKDVKLIWHRIEELKKEIWGFTERTKQFFERDLCFWDLKNKPEEYGRLSFTDILQKWNCFRAAGEKVKNADAVKKAVKQIQTYIDRMTPIEG